ncbi:SDR family NAD(P)-dependent oxidoreductase [Erythrobacter sp. EC-HK427]|uniref:SDR family NAD(P)-dependent oxidoreductase n=1 Tax=Erythrobacter sp. EC-HK427 TaxID=2038396 RepID=UPI0012522C3F|nr:SDR family NAD(P)-dependent oxidoreductase [Erythrobacter sp. EC-HK427]VVT21013.1 Ribosomal RNA small subunit methyltransferase G protein [Erythrobacter sp. EC-HK427]
MAAQLAGKTAIITGAASGIGLAITRLYLSEGARVLAVDRDSFDGTGLVEGDALAFLVVDITEADAPARIVETALARFSKFEILVNNAGVCLPGTVEDQTIDSWNQTIAINVTAPFLLTKAAIPHLKASGWGRIINVGSIMSDFGGPSLCAYGTSKHAIAGFTKSLAADLGKSNITANYLQPGAIMTPLAAPAMSDPAFRAYWEEKAPVGRIGEPEEVAAAALFLANESASYVNGAGLKVCGGAISRF